MTLGKGVRIRVVKKKPLLRRIFDFARGKGTRQYAEAVVYIDDDSWRDGEDDMAEWSKEEVYIW